MNLYNLFEAPKRTPAPGTTGVMDNQVQSAASPIGSGTSRWESKKKPVTMMGVGNNGVVAEARDVQLDEISNKILGDYKKAAGADASAADARGDVERGNKRFRGIVKATIKQGENDAKKHKEQGVAEGAKEDMSKEVKAMATGKCPHCHGPVQKKEHPTLTQYHCAKCGIRASIDKQGVAEGWREESQDLEDWAKEVNKKLYKAHASQRPALAQQLSQLEHKHFGSPANPLTRIVKSALTALRNGQMSHYDSDKVGAMPFGSLVGDDAKEIAAANLHASENQGYSILKRNRIVDTVDDFLRLVDVVRSLPPEYLFKYKDAGGQAWFEIVKDIGWSKDDAPGQRYRVSQGVAEGLKSMYHNAVAKHHGRKADDAFDDGDEEGFKKSMDKNISHKLKAGEKIPQVRDPKKFQQGVAESMGRATPKMPKPRDPGHAVLAAKRSSGAGGQHTNKKRQALLQPKHQQPVTRDMDMNEDVERHLMQMRHAGYNIK